MEKTTENRLWITEDGGIALSVNGNVIVQSISAWHALRAENERLTYLLRASEDACGANMQEVKKLREVLETIAVGGRGNYKKIARAALSQLQGDDK